MMVARIAKSCVVKISSGFGEDFSLGEGGKGFFRNQLMVFATREGVRDNIDSTEERRDFDPERESVGLGTSEGVRGLDTLAGRYAVGIVEVGK
jgi:hypothetical protein